MISYDLAKKLKDAGFIFKPIKAGMIVGTGQSHLDFCPDFDASKGDIVPEEGCHFFVPTLSELIEACPKEVGRGTFCLTSWGDNEGWMASYREYLDYEPDMDDYRQDAPTPEEAVANL